MIQCLAIELEKEPLETVRETSALTLPGLHWSSIVSRSDSSAKTRHFENFYFLVEPRSSSHRSTRSTLLIKCVRGQGDPFSIATYNKLVHVALGRYDAAVGAFHGMLLMPRERTVEGFEAEATPNLVRDGQETGLGCNWLTRRLMLFKFCATVDSSYSCKEIL